MENQDISNFEIILALTLTDKNTDCSVQSSKNPRLVLNGLIQLYMATEYCILPEMSVSDIM